METCRTLIADPDVVRPLRLGRKTPSEFARVELDNAERVDCASAGITITSSAFALHADDDDGSVTLDQDTFSGFVSSVRVAGGTAGKAYRLVNTVVTSDGRTLELTVALPVAVTEASAA